jgi:hypothetical protein
MRMLCLSPWAVALLTVLADVAPSPSCRDRSERVDGYMRIIASDCSCAPGSIRVTVDGSAAGEIACGTDQGIGLSVEVGSHSVSAASATASWPDRRYSVGSYTAIDLGCPQPAH